MQNTSSSTIFLQLPLLFCIFSSYHFYSPLTFSFPTLDQCLDSGLYGWNISGWLQFLLPSMTVATDKHFYSVLKKGWGKKEREQKMSYTFLPVLGYTVVRLQRFYPTSPKTSDLDGQEEEQGAPRALCWLAKSQKASSSMEKEEGVFPARCGAGRGAKLSGGHIMIDVGLGSI